MPDNLSEEIETGRVLLQQLDEVGIPHPQSPTKVVSRLFRQAPSSSELECRWSALLSRGQQGVRTGTNDSSFT